MTFKLPSLPDAGAATDVRLLAERFLRYATAVVDFLRGLPTIEFKTFRADGNDYPIYVETLTRKPLAVLRARTYEALDTSVVAPETGIGWHPSDDPDQPGIVVTEMDGITAGATEYEVVVVVLGERT